MDNNPVNSTPPAPANPFPQEPNPVATAPAQTPPTQTPSATQATTSTSGQPPVKKSKSKWILIILVLLAILAAAGIGGYFMMNQMKSAEPTAEVSPTPNPNEQAACTMEAKLCPDGVTYVGRSGPKCEFQACPTDTSSSSAILDKTYTSKEGDWQIDYPSTIKAEARTATQIGPNGIGTPVIFSMLGPTQGSGTEFHDGISYSVGVLKKPAATSLQKFAEEQTKPNPEVGSTSTPLKAVTVNGLSGYETVTSGLGEFRIVFLNYPGNQEKVYYMAIFSDGPGDSGNKYDEITEAMFQSFKNTK